MRDAHSKSETGSSNGRHADVARHGAYEVYLLAVGLRALQRVGREILVQPCRGDGGQVAPSQMLSTLAADVSVRRKASCTSWQLLSQDDRRDLDLDEKKVVLVAVVVVMAAVVAVGSCLGLGRDAKRPGQGCAWGGVPPLTAQVDYLHDVVASHEQRGVAEEILGLVLPKGAQRSGGWRESVISLARAHAGGARGGVLLFSAKRSGLAACAPWRP